MIVFKVDIIVMSLLPLLSLLLVVTMCLLRTVYDVREYEYVCSNLLSSWSVIIAIVDGLWLLIVVAYIYTQRAASTC